MIGADIEPGAETDSEWVRTEGFQRGQGYYQLLMYDRAIDEFEAVTNLSPNFFAGESIPSFGVFTDRQLR